MVLLAAVLLATAVVAPSVGTALAVAEEGSRPSVVCVAGSLMLVGDALRHLDGGDKPCPVENTADSIKTLF